MFPKVSLSSRCNCTQVSVRGYVETMTVRREGRWKGRGRRENGGKAVRWRGCDSRTRGFRAPLCVRAARHNVSPLTQLHARLPGHDERAAHRRETTTTNRISNGRRNVAHCYARGLRRLTSATFPSRFKQTLSPRLASLFPYYLPNVIM